MKEVGLYIHIPFCKQKCLYCDFNSYVCKDAQVENYITALIQELRMYQKEHKLKYKTIYIGGGTPTYIHYEHIGAVMREVMPHALENAEISMECNPGTVNLESLKEYRQMGINRLSIGLQAWQEKLQKSIGRIHDTNQFIRNIEQAKEAGFANISADLMFALPGQDLDMWLETLDNVTKLDLQHISCYSLKIEEDTPMHKLYMDNKLTLPDDELDRQMYHDGLRLLQERGLGQYEISNFAVPGFECRHNVLYWDNEDYIGVGAGSHSKMNHVRFNNLRSIQEYIQKINEGQYPLEEEIHIGEEEDMWETIILALRMNKGLDISVFNKKYHVDFEERYRTALKKLMKAGLLKKEENHLKLTIRGMDISNSVYIEFLE